MIQLKESTQEVDRLLDKYHGALTVSNIIDWTCDYLVSYDGDDPHILNAQYAYRHCPEEVLKFINMFIEDLFTELKEYERTHADIDDTYYEIEDMTDCTKWDWSEFDYYEDVRVAKSKADFEADYPGYGTVYHD